MKKRNDSIVWALAVFLMVMAAAHYIFSEVRDNIDPMEQPTVSEVYYNRVCTTKKFDHPSKVEKVRTCVWERD